MDKTHKIQACLCLVICPDVWQDSLIGKGANVFKPGGYKMSVLNLEDVIVEAATELAIAGECDVPVDNVYGGVDLIAAGSYDDVMKDFHKGFRDGVRFAIEDGTVHVYKFERFGVVARASFSGSFSTLSSVLVAIAKEWI